MPNNFSKVWKKIQIRYSIWFTARLNKCTKCESFHFLITLLPIFLLDINGHYEERGANLEAEHKFLLYRKYNRVFDRENSM